jgi:hypothetical protein
MPPGQEVVTVELKVNLLAPGESGGSRLSGRFCVRAPSSVAKSPGRINELGRPSEQRDPRLKGALWSFDLARTTVARL